MREGVGVAAVGFFVILCGIIALALGSVGGVVAIAVGLLLVCAGVSDARVRGMR